MKRKLAAIWRILTCKKYLLVIKEDSEEGPDILFDFTMPKSDAKMVSAFLFDIIDEQDKIEEQNKLVQEQDKTLQAFKKILS
jgi:hypothetical protein